MSRTVARGLLALTLVAPAAFFSCSSFSGTDTGSSDGGGGDGGGGGGTASLDGASMQPDGAGVQKDAAISPAPGPRIRGFSKAGSTAGSTGTLMVPRPPNTQKGDLLVLVASFNANQAPSLPEFSPRIVGQCPDANNFLFVAGTRRDNGSASYAITYDPNHVGEGDVILVAIADAGLPDDLSLQSADAGTGAAPPVMIMHPQDLVLVAFSDVTGETFSTTVDAGVSWVTSTNRLAIYQGTYPAGRTPPIGPFAQKTACWGALTVAIPPAP